MSYELGTKYLMTECDGETKKEIFYKGSHQRSFTTMHTIYDIENEIEFDVPEEILILMDLTEIN